MIRADLHNHTWYSHGAATTAEMFAAAQKNGPGVVRFFRAFPAALGVCLRPVPPRRSERSVSGIRT